MPSAPPAACSCAGTSDVVHVTLAVLPAPTCARCGSTAMESASVMVACVPATSADASVAKRMAPSGPGTPGSMVTPRSVAVPGAPGPPLTPTPTVPPSSSDESTSSDPGAMVGERLTTAVFAAFSTLRRTFTWA